MKRSLIPIVLASIMGCLLLPANPALAACVGAYIPIAHIESNITDQPNGCLRDGMGFVSSTTAVSTIMGIATPDCEYGSQADADTTGVIYEIWEIIDRNGDGVFNAYDDTPTQTWALVNHTVCDGSPGHVVGWDGNEGNLLQEGSTITVSASRCYLFKIRAYDAAGNTSTEVDGSDVWFTTGADSYLGRNGDAAQGLDDNEVLWLRVPMRPPPNVGGASGTVTTTSSSTTTTTGTTTTTTTTLPANPSYVVSGAGTTGVNGNYCEQGTYNGYPRYAKGMYQLRRELSGKWSISALNGDPRFYITTNPHTTPPSTDWGLGPYGAAPVPLVEAWVP